MANELLTADSSSPLYEQVIQHLRTEISSGSYQPGQRMPSEAELCRKYGIAEQTYYKWHKKYGGMDAGDARRLKDLELENNRLKKMVAELSLDKHILEELLTKNF